MPIAELRKEEEDRIVQTRGSRITGGVGRSCGFARAKVASQLNVLNVHTRFRSLLCINIQFYFSV